MQLIDALGLDIRLFVAQLVNFAIVLYILYRFAYGPVIDFVEKRRQKIADGIVNAEKAEKEMARATVDGERIIREARVEALSIISKARDDAEVEAARTREENRVKILSYAKGIKSSIEDDKRKILRETKKEVGEMGLSIAEKILEQKVGDKIEAAWLDKAVKNLTV